MADSTAIIVSYKSSSNVLLVKNEVTLSKIMEFMKLKWKKLDAAEIEVKYTLPNLPECGLESEDDVQSMMFLAMSTNSKIINISVKDVEKPSMELSIYKNVIDRPEIIELNNDSIFGSGVVDRANRIQGQVTDHGYFVIDVDEEDNESLASCNRQTFISAMLTSTEPEKLEAENSNDAMRRKEVDCAVNAEPTYIEAMASSPLRTELGKDKIICSPETKSMDQNISGTGGSNITMVDDISPGPSSVNKRSYSSMMDFDMPSFDLLSQEAVNDELLTSVLDEFENMEKSVDAQMNDDTEIGTDEPGEADSSPPIPDGTYSPDYFGKEFDTSFLDNHIFDLSLSPGHTTNAPDPNSKPRLTASWSSLITHIGQIFPGGAEEVKDVLIKFSFENGFKFKYTKNCRAKVAAECAKKQSDACAWFISTHLKPGNGSFYIRKLNNVHTCTPFTDAECSKRLGRNFLSKLIVHMVREKFSTIPGDIRSFFLANYDFDIDYNKAWHVLDSAKKAVFGNYNDSFSELNWYIPALKQFNPGTHTDLDVDEKSKKFKRVFVALNACIKGFESCRPMLFVDGTFLKGRYLGTLMCAVTKDANNGIFPVAVAVCDGENMNNWDWFMDNLRQSLSLDREYCFITDRNHGLVKAIEQHFPRSNQFYCARHLRNNLQKMLTTSSASHENKQRALGLFYKAAETPSRNTFHKLLAAFKSIDIIVAQRFLRDLPYERWALSYSPQLRYGEVTNNAAECYNGWALPARDMPVAHLVSFLNERLMKTFNARRIEGLEYRSTICINMYKQWADLQRYGRGLIVLQSSQHIFSVKSSPAHTVDINLKTCSCCEWQASGFPCIHAIAVARKMRIPETFIVDKFFLIDAYKECYSSAIYPVPTSSRDDFLIEEDSAILPPDTRRPPGRPKKKRYKSKFESAKQPITCGRCGRVGSHNRKTCKEPLRS